MIVFSPEQAQELHFALKFFPGNGWLSHKREMRLSMEVDAGPTAQEQL